MKWKIKLITLKSIIISLIFFLFVNYSLSAEEISFEIKGNNFTDSEVVLSILDQLPKNNDKEYTNDIINALNESNLFSNVRVKFIDNKYIITIQEFPNIDKFYFKNNERLDDEELLLLASEMQIERLNKTSINLFINEIKKIYQSFGYNNIKIQYIENFYQDSNTVDLTFNIDEGKITKINKITIKGNDEVSSQEILEVISSKTKSFRDIFANNNFKPISLERDKFLISNYYKNNGFIDIQVETQVEYLKSNRVNLFFNINEGDIYLLSSIKISDEKNILDKKTLLLVNEEINNFTNKNKIFSLDKIEELRNQISKITIDNGNEFFELKYYDKVINKNVDLIFKILPISPKYIKQINITGNTRTFDYVIRRELNIVEGDAIYPSQIINIREKIASLKLFESVNVKEEILGNNEVNLIIDIKEKQTGTFNAGVSVGTLDGFSIVTGLRERNFYGTGRLLDVLVNTSEDKNQFKLITTDRLSYENDANINYNINYKQEDFSNASSYKLNTFSTGIGIGYKLNRNLNHNVDLEYVLKDYNITNSSTVSSSILSSSGENISFLLKNNLRFSTLNPGFISKKGNFINYNNTIETPTSSSNGFVRNIITYKYFNNYNKNIYSIQTKLGNIFSLNNNDILTDDKFALGGRWLRGFDNYGAGPRNSRNSYVGGNNIFVTKFDYSYEITKKSDFPVLLNLFNDYGIIWQNKTTPTQSDNNLRASLGFGLKYYSPIGPIGFSWGFPIIDEEYDIKRMFLFSIGNLD